MTNAPKFAFSTYSTGIFTSFALIGYVSSNAFFAQMQRTNSEISLVRLHLSLRKMTEVHSAKLTSMLPSSKWQMSTFIPFPCFVSRVANIVGKSLLLNRARSSSRRNSPFMSVNVLMSHSCLLPMILTSVTFAVEANESFTNSPWYVYSPCCW